MSNQPQEFEELSIETVAGLQAFLRNAQVQYNIGLEKEADLIGVQNYDYGESLHEAFQKVRKTNNRLIQKVQAGDSITNKDAEDLQSTYDELIAVITDVERSLKSAPKQSEEPVKRIEVQSESVQDEEGESKVALEINDKEPSSESVPELKPRTGSLKIASDDSEIVDVKDKLQVTKTINDDAVGTTKKKKKRRRRKKKKNKSNNIATEQNDNGSKVMEIVTQSQASLAKLQKTYLKPNEVQRMLFEEVRESIEQLEILAKKNSVSSTQLASVAEVASHIKFALEAISEATEVEVEEVEERNAVPVVTEHVQEVSTEKRERIDSIRPVSFVPTSVVSNKPDRTKQRAVPKSLQTLPRPNDVHLKESLTDMYLTMPKYHRFIIEHYSSTKAFERILDATITQIESETIDQIEKWLGDLPASAFSFLKDMTVSEALSFSDRPYEKVAADLAKENVKYETFASWRDLLGEMLSMLPNGKNMRFGELFAVWMIELAMQEV